jgi:hypothetical protein
MRIECQNDRRCTGQSRVNASLADDALMAEVNTVKHTDGEESVGWKFRE